MYSAGEALERRFEVRIPVPAEARYNIAPSQSVGVVRHSPESGEREWRVLHWGLIPSWAKDRRVGYKMINARAETLAEKPAFRTAYRCRRCLIPADGFYEWRRKGATKQPYFIHLKDQSSFAFAGLWESWAAPDGTTLDSCTIITTPATTLVQPIHDRMPAILSSADYAEWLDPALTGPGRLQALLRPYESEAMSAYRIGFGVNSPRNQGPELLEPLAGGEST